MFYLKMAWNNLKKTKEVVVPFILASIVLFMLNTIVMLLLTGPVSENMQNGKILLLLASVVLLIFATIMEIYSYLFFIKQRSREFGLYTVLGMTKKQVGLVASYELLITYLGVIGLGSLFSGIFSHLFYLIFANLLHYQDLRLHINFIAFLITIVLFGFIFLLLEIIGMVKIGKSSPLLLFRDQEQGEVEPRGNKLLAALALLSIGFGYYLSLSSTKIAAMAVIYRFFIAVIFVIIGTYLFYISFMTWYLKRKRQNKRYYYQPKHFITTAQMIFRMKQNAVGLANITILAVMAFVAIATSTALYTNSESQLNQLFPKNTKITFDNPNDLNHQKQFQELILPKLQLRESDYISYTSAMVNFNNDNDKKIAITKKSLQNPNFKTLTNSFIIPEKDFRALGNTVPTLKDNQMIFFQQKNTSHLNEISIFGKNYHVVKNLKTAKLPEIANTYNPTIMVVKDLKIMRQIIDSFNKHSGMKANITSDLTVLAELSEKEMKSIADPNSVAISHGKDYLAYYERKENFQKDYYVITGGFLFTGFLLGLSFILGAALIIYYKQYTEGHLDKKSYTILQEVGMSIDQIKKAINSQLLVVFFMPISLAILHFSAAMVMIKQMLLLFGVTDVHMIYNVSALTISLIILIYYVIYKLTSKTYYKIIER
ncbi:ABC transporter permease [Streptococcus uberis]|uniref:ABC transporter permease n=1 Tax=Streptococcus uberis TaxID=1349 RepID=UPI0038D51783